MATWDQVQHNRTLYSLALEPGEGQDFRWHKDADQEHSSQVFCVSAFGTLRGLPIQDRIINQFLGFPAQVVEKTSEWKIKLEVEQPGLLSEYGRVQPSSIDAVLQNRNAVFCLESKFLADAQAGFGPCSQPRGKKSSRKCAGFYGPGSDVKTGTNAWCRLEVWDGHRSPRTYWAMGRAFFRDSVYARQASGETCPFAGSNYQLMRNFLFSAALAQRKSVGTFGVKVVAPARMVNRLERQIDIFRTSVLQPQFGALVELLPYERLIDLLCQSGDKAGKALADFLSERIANLIPLLTN